MAELIDNDEELEARALNSALPYKIPMVADFIIGSMGGLLFAEGVVDFVTGSGEKGPLEMLGGVLIAGFYMFRSRDSAVAYDDAFDAIYYDE